MVFFDKQNDLLMAYRLGGTVSKINWIKKVHHHNCKNFIRMSSFKLFNTSNYFTQKVNLYIYRGDIHKIQKYHCVCSHIYKVQSIPRPNNNSYLYIIAVIHCFQSAIRGYCSSTLRHIGAYFLHMGYTTTTITGGSVVPIYVDSQAALKSLQCKTVHSSLVSSYKGELEWGITMDP
ncbi:hypothetical protein FF38_05156 [Lucilia cuprina]|uniref:Uncharacterized protein n=1 Tax=Lucilia cuprina TaxID=7375 RepID=A0A0L0C245_LUCCU|nr:hypothetical protein FF38_05156 [Lucilia cuprina]